MPKVDLLKELLLPEYKQRHIFAAKLRLMAFIGFWIIYLYFMHDVLAQTVVIAAIVFASFLLTGFAYHNVMKGRFLIPSLVIELISDLTAITAVLYLTGGPHSPYYTIYLFYVIVAGMLYNFYMAAFVAIGCAIYYGAFLLLCHYGIIPPLIIDYGENLPIPTYTATAHFIFSVIFLGAIVYTVKIANAFSQRREKILEKRNREMTAIQRMTSTIRSAAALKDVIEHLLSCVVEGLGFKAAALVHFDKSRGTARFYLPRGMPHASEVADVLRMPLDRMEFTIDELKGPVLRDVMKHRLIFRKELGELAQGLGGEELTNRCHEIQRILDFKRIVVMPIVAEKELLGALVGFSGEPFVEDGQVATMESFANQSALSLEAAMLIDRLKRVNQDLEEASRVKSEFLATMSHELRTPLTAIIGFSELMIEGVMGELNEEQIESLEEVLQNSADLLEMINSLLDLTKIESGKMKVDAREYDLRETLKRVCNTVAPLVQKKSQELTTDLPKGFPSITGDERKIQQVMLNLVANANKFTPEKGTITATLKHYGSWKEVETNADLARRLRDVAHLCVDGCIEIAIEDNGMGIKPEHLETVFDMFHQADSSSTRSFGGTGLGLALARRFVEMHGGRIWAESRYGEGARFVFVIPTRPRQS